MGLLSIVRCNIVCVNTVVQVAAHLGNHDQVDNARYDRLAREVRVFPANCEFGAENVLAGRRTGDDGC